MNISRAFKFRLRLTTEQERQCSQFAGSCRFVWNKSLALKTEAYEQRKESLSAFALNKLLTEWKQESPWLSGSPSQTLQQVQKDLDQAFQNFFRRIKTGEAPGYPKFKKKGFSDSFRFPQGITLCPKLSRKVGQVKLPKLGIVQYTRSRDVEGRIRNVTVSRSGKHWYISFNCEVEAPEPVSVSDSAVGIDRGIAIFAQCSDETSYEGVSPLQRNMKRLAKLQRSLSRKKKLSRNWIKAKRKVSTLHTYVANVRKDYLHKVSSDLTKNHGEVVMEDLKVRNMSSSAKGTIDKPGRNVKAKAGLNRSILDQGWSMFQIFLAYKLEARGGLLKLIDPKNTSRKCSCCGYTSADNRVSQSKFLCLSCGVTMNADLNAARNILMAGGHLVSACGEVLKLDASVKQESLCTKSLLGISQGIPVL